MWGTFYVTAGTIPATIKTRYRKTTTAVTGKVKALFKKAVTPIHKSPTTDLDSTFLWIDARTPYHHGESRMITLPPADEDTDGGYPGWLSARDEDRVPQPTPSHHVNITAPSPAYAEFCRERVERRAKFQACLDHGSIEDLAEFEAGLIEDGLLQERRAVLAHRGAKVEESRETDLAVEEGVVGFDAAADDLANTGIEQRKDVEITEHRDATKSDGKLQGTDAEAPESIVRAEETDGETKQEDVSGG
ncbi:hypothetical protein LTR29_009818 [Friedmanniomyces endolithicus]|nr:hypothetical protein LTR29_009818 [Friedmanniomyces endolithicus]